MPPLYSNGYLIATTADGVSYYLPRGYYQLTAAGQIERWDDGTGMQGFWSSIGGGFSSIGKWVQNHFVPIVQLGAGAFIIHQGLAQQSAGSVSALQQAAAQQQAQAAAVNAAAAANTVGGDLASYLPLIAIGVLAVIMLTR